MKTIRHTIAAFTLKLQKALNKKKFYSNEVKELNELLEAMAKSIQYGFFTPKEAIELENRIQLCGLKILVLKVNIDGVPNITGVSDLLLEPLHNQLESVRKEKVDVVKQQKYEDAAKLRDQEQRIADKVYDVIQDDLKLVDGFNYYDNMILIVHPKDVQKSVAIKSLLQNIGT